MAVRGGFLRSDEPRPIEYCGTQFEERRIQVPQRMCEPQPPSFQGRHRLTEGGYLVEVGLIHLPRPIRIGKREGRAGRCPLHAEVDQLAESGRQAAAVLSERVRAAPLAKNTATK